MTVTESQTPEPTDLTSEAALAIDGLEMSYVVRGTPRKILRGVTFEVRQGEAYKSIDASISARSMPAMRARTSMMTSDMVNSVCAAITDK